MINPAPVGTPNVCPNCHGFARPGFSQCYGCANNPRELEVIVPISYSIHLEQMHTELRHYKNPEYLAKARSRFRVGLTSVLWRFLAAHEDCVAAAAGVSSFDCVVTVPSNRRERDDRPGGLRKIVGEMCGHTRDRYIRALRPTDHGTDRREFDPLRFKAIEPVAGARVLLIDDTWTTGSRAQSAAHVLRQANADKVACVVFGRHVRRDFENTDEILRALPRFNWSNCSVHP